MILHIWLRLLIGYHSPSLAQYLDKVLPGWEKPDHTNIFGEVSHNNI
jgi:hypothetical protein